MRCRFRRVIGVVLAVVSVMLLLVLVLVWRSTYAGNIHLGVRLWEGATAELLLREGRLAIGGTQVQTAARHDTWIPPLAGGRDFQPPYHTSTLILLTAAPPHRWSYSRTALSTHYGPLSSNSGAGGFNVVWEHRHRGFDRSTMGMHLISYRGIQMPIWFGVLLLALWPAWLVYRRIRGKRRRGADGQSAPCLNCGYDLRGSACPECGKPILPRSFN